MVFQLFSTSVFTSPAADLADLPLELSTIIFRMLDAESLVSAASVNRSWCRICRSDGVLRRSVRRQLRKKRREQKKKIIDPSYGVKVVRNGTSSLFSRNVVKDVSVRKVSTDNPATPRNVPINVYNGAFENGTFVGPIRRKKTSSATRTAPYKLLRM